ncbi:MAG: hypothetical protein PHN45_05245 [Methylococcales bacterium]|nr:hypothetical protein [Methylococcales bacterium]MDD5754142.1 hypothetical protein [Methylococcales bacterium]
MGILIFIIIVLFIAGGLLILLRSANSHKLPKGITSQPYSDEDD